MGIPGIYKELGPGERTALSKLAIQHLEDTGRPLRLAIDIAIWQFQIKVTPGGQNPAIRTLYYRLLKLLSLSIQPLFVFDGPYRPSFKRGVKRAPFTASVDNFLTKHMLKSFGFPFHDAPGEAEAECALLQKEGIVDAVMSEDVDTIMFGSTICLRNWSAEGGRANKSPTHVDVYRAEHTKETARIDSDGMVLVALMSGGDYIQAGIPSCGIKTACLAARANFGSDLCKISKDDGLALMIWRQRLEHEIRTNESQFFQRRKKDFKIPDTFPDKVVLNYYTHPTVSSRDKLTRLRDSISWENEIDVPGLRKFVEEAFGWTYRIGATHFIRGLAPALLVRKLVRRGLNFETNRETLNTKELAECHLVKAVCGRRNHFVTDGEPELRIAYIANDVTLLDLDAEDDVEVAVDEDGEEDADVQGSGDEIQRRSRSPTKRKTTYDPTVVEKIWLLESFVKLGAPLLVETWEEDMRDPKKFAVRKAREKKKLDAAAKAPKQSSIQHYVIPMKPAQFSRLQGDGPEPSKQQRRTATKTAQGISPSRQIEAPKLPKLDYRDVGVENIKNMKQIAPHKREVATTRLTSLETAFDNAVRARLRQYHEQNPRLQPAGSKSAEAFITPRSKTRLAKHHRSPSPPLNKQSCPQTPMSRGCSSPSPRKKRSPMSAATQMLSDYHIKTPDGTPRRGQMQSTLDVFVATPKSEKEVNRIIDFTSPVQPPFDASKEVEDPVLNISTDDEDEFPSPSLLLRPPEQQVTSRLLIHGDAKGVPLAMKKVKKVVMIRESLEGAWKYVDEDDVQTKGPKSNKVFADVKVVDLTAD